MRAPQIKLIKSLLTQVKATSPLSSSDRQQAADFCLLKGKLGGFPARMRAPQIKLIKSLLTQVKATSPLSSSDRQQAADFCLLKGKLGKEASQA